MSGTGSFRKLAELTEKKILEAKNKLLLLDFDGTLVDFAADISGANPPEDLLHLLHRLSLMPGCTLVIITGRRKEDIGHLLGELKIDIVAEHGAMIRESGNWRALLINNTGWKDKIYPVMKKYTSQLPGSVLEEKSYSLAWHYRNVESGTGRTFSDALMRELREQSASLNLKIINGNKVVEILSNSVNKGEATRYLVSKNAFDYILSVGDDKTDEDMFSILSGNKNAYTVKIGSGETVADYSLDNVQQVKQILELLLTGIDNSDKDLAKDPENHEN